MKGRGRELGPWRAGEARLPSAPGLEQPRWDWDEELNPAAFKEQQRAF